MAAGVETQHAIWLTESLSRWHRQSLEVRDQEMHLHETNKQLRELSAAELDHLLDPAHYLGQAKTWVERAVAEHSALTA